MMFDGPLIDIWKDLLLAAIWLDVVGWVVVAAFLVFLHRQAHAS